MTNKLEAMEQDVLSKLEVRIKSLPDDLQAELLRRLGASGVPQGLLIRCKKTGGTLIYERTAPNEITVYHESGCEAGASGVDVPKEIAFAKDSSTGEWSCWCEGCEWLRKHIAHPAAPALNPEEEK